MPSFAQAAELKCFESTDRNSCFRWNICATLLFVGRITYDKCALPANLSHLNRAHPLQGIRNMSLSPTASCALGGGGQRSSLEQARVAEHFCRENLRVTVRVTIEVTLRVTFCWVIAAVEELTSRRHCWPCHSIHMSLLQGAGAACPHRPPPTFAAEAQALKP